MGKGESAFDRGLVIRTAAWWSERKARLCDSSLVIGEKERSLREREREREREKLDGARERERGLNGLKYTKFFWHSATVPSHVRWYYSAMPKKFGL